METCRIKEHLADDASRGLSADELMTNTKWSRGLEFLWKTKEHWPKSQDPSTLPDLLRVDVEVKQETKSYVAVVSTIKKEEEFMERIINKISSWMKLKKAVAWLVKFKQWMVHRSSSGGPWSLACTNLTVDEVQNKENLIIKHLQQNYFPKENNALNQDGKRVHKGSSIYKLEPFMGKVELVRVGGRLHKASISENAKHPVIVPRDIM